MKKWLIIAEVLLVCFIAVIMCKIYTNKLKSGKGKIELKAVSYIKK